MCLPDIQVSATKMICTRYTKEKDGRHHRPTTMYHLLGNNIHTNLMTNKTRHAVDTFRNAIDDSSDRCLHGLVFDVLKRGPEWFGQEVKWAEASHPSQWPP